MSSGSVTRVGCKYGFLGAKEWQRAASFLVAKLQFSKVVNNYKSQHEHIFPVDIGTIEKMVRQYGYSGDGCCNDKDLV